MMFKVSVKKKVLEKCFGLCNISSFRYEMKKANSLKLAYIVSLILVDLFSLMDVASVHGYCL
jgi:hypothetical protein